MKAPFGHWGTQTFIAALRHDGLTAPWVIDRPMNREIFETYVETQLVVREQCVFAVRDEVILAGLHGFRLRPLQVVIGTRCAIV